MTAALLRASAATLPRRSVGVPLAAALGLLVLAAPALRTDEGAVLVLRGVALLLVTALASVVDEATPQQFDAAPTSLAQRLAARAAVGGAVLLPAWVLALVVATLAGADVPAAAVTLELAALAALGLAAPVALRRWRGTPEPAVVTGPLLLGVLLLGLQLPEPLSLLPFSPQDPSWGPAHLRWGLVLLAACGLLGAAAGDPGAGRPSRRRAPAGPLRPVAPAAPPGRRART